MAMSAQPEQKTELATERRQRLAAGMGGAGIEGPRAYGKARPEQKTELATERRQRLAAAMREAGIERLVLYGNAWQGDYLRYGSDFGILEGHGIALVGRDGSADLYLDSATEAGRAELEGPEIAVH